MSGATIVGHEQCREVIHRTPVPPPPGIWSEVDWGAARATDLGAFSDLLDSERIVGNLHRAHLELEGAERGAPTPRENRTMAWLNADQQKLITGENRAPVRSIQA
jgi:hypothetical protein